MKFLQRIITTEHKNCKYRQMNFLKKTKYQRLKYEA